jgi:mono/diheme cytochrome c family protein
MNKKKMAFSLLIASGIFFNACSHKTITTNKPMDATLLSTASITEGEKTYKSNCGKCHELKDPAEFSQKEWGPIMRSMAKKAHLDDAQKNNVTAYVFSLAKR